MLTKINILLFPFLIEILTATFVHVVISKEFI